MCGDVQDNATAHKEDSLCMCVCKSVCVYVYKHVLVLQAAYIGVRGSHKTATPRKGMGL